MNSMLQFLTPHTFEQSFSYSMNIKSKLRNGLNRKGNLYLFPYLMFDPELIFVK